MTPKEKAIELVNSCNDLAKDFTRGVSMNEFSKQFALLIVDEIIDLLPNINLIPPIQRRPDEFYFQYWGIVKQEIEKL